MFNRFSCLTQSFPRRLVLVVVLPLEFLIAQSLVRRRVLVVVQSLEFLTFFSPLSKVLKTYCQTLFFVSPWMLFRQFWHFEVIFGHRCLQGQLSTNFRNRSGIKKILPEPFQNLDSLSMRILFCKGLLSC